MKHRQGFVLVAVLLVMLVVSLLVIGTAFTTVIDRNIAANQRGSTDAYYIAKAGADKYKTMAFQTYRYYLEHLDEYKADLTPDDSVCGNFLRIGLDLNRDGDFDDVGDLKNGGEPRTFTEGNGTYEITFSADEQYFILKSVGRVGRSRSTVQLVLEARNASVASNALFVGDGGIRGSVNIYGSAYIKKEAASLSPTGIVARRNSSFAIHNFYKKQTLTNLFRDNTDATVKDVKFLRGNFHNQGNLCSKLRVEDADQQLGDSVNLGDVSTDPDFKGNLAGVHVGNDATSSLLNSTGVHADLKTSLDIDEADYLSLDQKLCERDDDKTWRVCLREDAGLLIESGSCGLTGSQIEFGATDVTCEDTDLSGKKVGFEYKAGSQELKVFGLVNVRGLDLKFKENIKLQIDGEATFFVEDGNVTIDGNLVPRKIEDLPSGNSFPYTNDVLGIIADGQIKMTSESDNQVVVGMFYAGEPVEVAEGTTVFGTVMTPKLCITDAPANPANPPVTCDGTQPANFVKIPDLEYHLPPGFDQLSRATVPTFRVASFERR